MTENIIKYTSDGKKVVVIGDLNQTDKIVQEIYINNNGDEIPAGERFIAKSLFDEPVKSWKERQLEYAEKEYDLMYKEWQEKINKLNEEKQRCYASLDARVKWLKNVAKQPHPEQLKQIISNLADLLSPEGVWVAVCDWGNWFLEKLSEEGAKRLDMIDNSYGHHVFKGMKLLSLYGKSDGNLQWHIDEYGDGSGYGENVAFFHTREEGLKFLQNKLDSYEEYSSTLIAIAEKLELKLDKDKLKEYYIKVINSSKESVIFSEKNLTKEKEYLEGMENKLRNIE